MTFRRLLILFGFSVFIGWSFGFIGEAERANAWYCEPGQNISYDDAVQEIAAGRIVITASVTNDPRQVTVSVTNNTFCNIPVSLASYKMFEPYNISTLSKQEFYDGTATVTLTPNESKSLSVSLPSCAASYVLWYGDVIKVQTDNRVYGEFLYGDQVKVNYLCTEDSPNPPDTEPVSTTTPEIPPVDDTGATSTPPTSTTTDQTATSTPESATTTDQTSTTTPPTSTSTPETSVATSTPVPSTSTTGSGSGSGGVPGSVSLYPGSGPAASVSAAGGGAVLPQQSQVSGVLPTSFDTAYAAPVLPSAGIGPSNQQSVLRMFLRWIGFD